MSSIDIHDVSYCYRDNNEVYLALEDIDLSISDGEFVCLVGHSGCGKSTLLSLLAGLNAPDTGEILVGGRPIDGPSISRAMVFQHYSLFPWMRVAKNVAFSIQQSGRNLPPDQLQGEVRKYLAEVGMKEAADKYPFQLSGGMQQRVAIARALAMESDILLLDEPFGALDARTRAELQHLLMELWQNSEHRRTVVFVTHDLTEAMLLADRIVFMEPRHIKQLIDVDFPHPRSLEELEMNPKFRILRTELLDLFYTNQPQELLQGTDERAVDETKREFHYDAIEGGA